MSKQEIKSGQEPENKHLKLKQELQREPSSTVTILLDETVDQPRMALDFVYGERPLDVDQTFDSNTLAILLSSTVRGTRKR